MKYCILSTSIVLLAPHLTQAVTYEVPVPMQSWSSAFASNPPLIYSGGTNTFLQHQFSWTNTTFQILDYRIDENTTDITLSWISSMYSGDVIGDPSTVEVILFGMPDADPIMNYNGNESMAGNPFTWQMAYYYSSEFVLNYSYNNQPLTVSCFDYVDFSQFTGRNLGISIRAFTAKMTPEENEQQNPYFYVTLSDFKLMVTTGSPIPEPSSYASIAGLAVLGGIALRRRRK